ncbi:MAG: hypothetical protein Q9218_003314 [Villophora microphyllina]
MIISITHPASTTATFAGECWNDAQSRHTIAFKDCIDVVKDQIIADHDLDIPLKFSQNAELGPDIKLPAHWFSRTGNCFVGINFAPGQTGSDRMSPRDLRRAAQILGVKCVIQPPHLGGVVPMGWHEKMGLVFIAEQGQKANENGTLSTE